MKVLYFEIAFFITLIGSIYSYAIYPMLLLLLKKPQSVLFENLPERYPSVSLIIAAHNEENNILEKLENSLELEYVEGKLEIIIASDGSTDGTNAIVRRYADKGVKLIEVTDHKGKEHAQLCAVNEALGDIIVFSDVATSIEKHCLYKLVSYFSDPMIGAVSSEDRFISQDGGSGGEGAYVKYEMWLRRQESQLAGLVGLSGSFFAAKKEVCEEWDIRSTSDFNIALNCAKKGLKAVTMPDVFGYYKDLSDPQKEYQRKVRTLIHGFTAITRHAEVLNPFRFGMFSFQMWSHKIMRWLVPWFLVLFFIFSTILYKQNWFFELTFVSQLIFYGLVLIAYFVSPLRQIGLVKIPYFFVQVNLAIFHATLQFLTGKRMYTWVPSKR